MKLALLTPPGEGQLGVSLARGFAEEGHDVRLVPAAGLTSDGRVMPRMRRARVDAPLSRALVEVAARRCGDPDVVLVMRGRFLRQRDVERLRQRTGAPVVNFYPDNPLVGRLRERAFLQALPAYDLVAVWCEALAAALAGAGVRRTAVVPFGYDPELFSPAPPGGVPAIDVAFVGSASPHRVRWLSQLAGLRLALAGPRWGRLARGTALAGSVLAGPRWGRSAAHVYWSAKVGVNVLDPQNLIGHNMRTWELPATERATVMTRTRDHEALFARGGAVLVDRPEELRPAVERLLADAAARDAVAGAGRLAVRGGTYRARAAELVAAFARLPST